jgi:proteic killer suppression protein
VIQSFRCAETEALHNGFSSRKFQSIERAAQKRLRWLHGATDFKDLAAIQGNRLEALKGDRIGRHSIRINERWRIRFRWHDGQAYDVEIVDCHS